MTCLGITFKHHHWTQTDQAWSLRNSGNVRCLMSPSQAEKAACCYVKEMTKRMWKRWPNSSAVDSLQKTKEVGLKIIPTQWFLVFVLFCFSGALTISHFAPICTDYLYTIHTSNHVGIHTLLPPKHRWWGGFRDREAIEIRTCQTARSRIGRPMR